MKAEGEGSVEARVGIERGRPQPGTFTPDSVSLLHDTWITKFPSLCSALEESPG